MYGLVQALWRTGPREGGIGRTRAMAEELQSTPVAGWCSMRGRRNERHDTQLRGVCSAAPTGKGASGGFAGRMRPQAAR